MKPTLADQDKNDYQKLSSDAEMSSDKPSSNNKTLSNNQAQQNIPIPQDKGILPNIMSAREQLGRFEESPKHRNPNEEVTISRKESQKGIEIPESTENELNVTREGLSRDKLLVLKVASDRNMISPNTRP